MTTTTRIVQPSTRTACPDWCIVYDRSADRDHAHYGIADDWDGPGRLLVEVGVIQHRDGTAEVVVEAETYDEHGETVTHTVTAYSPAEALSAARHPAADGRLAAALVAAAGILGHGEDEEVSS